MKTSTGRIIDPLNLRPEDVCIDDIAHHLSQICRFGGACKFHYSVAQHSVYVSLSAKGYALAGLLHDASEAYLCDIPRPIKYTQEFQFYRDLERKVQGMINEKFGLPAEIPDAVHKADNALLVAEGIQLMNELYTNYGPPADLTIKAMSPMDAKAVFLEAYQEILYDKAGFLASMKEREIACNLMH